MKRLALFLSVCMAACTQVIESDVDVVGSRDRWRGDIWVVTEAEGEACERLGEIRTRTLYKIDIALEDIARMVAKRGGNAMRVTEQTFDDPFPTVAVSGPWEYLSVAAYRCPLPR